MATTKETLRVIAEGFTGNETEEETGCMDCAVLEHLASLAAYNFGEMTEDMSDDDVLEIIDTLDREEAEDGPGELVDLLQRMFQQNGMTSAAAQVEVVHECALVNDDAYAIFADIFFDDDYIDWFCMENWIRGMFPANDHDIYEEDE